MDDQDSLLVWARLYENLYRQAVEVGLCQPNAHLSDGWSAEKIYYLLGFAHAIQVMDQEYFLIERRLDVAEKDRPARKGGPPAPRPA